jgi:hypothetical protein
MRSYASLLSSISVQLLDVSLRNVPMDTLLQLEDFMKDSNGRTNRRDLALLLEIGFAAFGVKKTLDPENIRHELKRAPRRKQGRANSQL